MLRASCALLPVNTILLLGQSTPIALEPVRANRVSRKEIDVNTYGVPCANSAKFSGKIRVIGMPAAAAAAPTSPLARSTGMRIPCSSYRAASFEGTNSRTFVLGIAVNRWCCWVTPSWPTMELE